MDSYVTAATPGFNRAGPKQVMVLRLWYSILCTFFAPWFINQITTNTEQIETKLFQSLWSLLATEGLAQGRYHFTYSGSMGCWVRCRILMRGVALLVGSSLAKRWRNYQLLSHALSQNCSEAWSTSFQNVQAGVAEGFSGKGALLTIISPLPLEQLWAIMTL